jgi:hypothetical protein
MVAVEYEPDSFREYSTLVNEKAKSFSEAEKKVFRQILVSLLQEIIQKKEAETRK